MKYLELISQGADEDKREQLQFAAEEAKHSVSISILETRKAISTAKKVLKDAKKAQPYSLQNVVDATIRIDSLERGLKIAQTIEKEDFS